MSNEFEHIDKIIRDKFAGFAPQPPESVWEKIRKHIGGNGGGSILFPVLTISGLLLVIVAMLLNDFPSGMYTSLRAGDIAQQPPVITPHTSSTGPLAITQTLLREKETHKAVSKEPAATVTETKTKESKTVTDRSTKSTQKAEESMATEAARRELLSGKMRMTRGFISEPGLDELVLMPRKQAGDYFSKSLADWSLGVWFNPEAITHNDPSLENTQGLGLHFSAAVRKGNLVFQTGIGVKNSKDRGNYQITYNEYLGSYQHVYNVTYDSTENGVVPTYHTETKDVYDTIPHYAITESKIHYRYLEVPLLIGYQKDLKKISLTVKGGLNASILLNSNASNTSLGDENIRVVSEERDLLERADVNWQLLLNAGISYRLNSRFSLGIEPSFRYYLSPEYKNLQGSKGSYGIGVRTGIIYHINR